MTLELMTWSGGIASPLKTTLSIPFQSISMSMVNGVGLKLGWKKTDDTQKPPL
jgi:hypothetical protein